MADTSASGRRKPMSPRAPGTDLRTAVAEVAKVYLRYSHGGFTKGELASALGMSAVSGTFLSKTAALRDYGLIEETPGGERVSDLFRSIYQAPAGSNEVRRAALAAINHSPAFARLLQQFSTRVPDESALALRLESQDRFNPDRAKVVATAFRRSLAEYGLIDQAGNVLPVREGEADDFRQPATVDESEGERETLQNLFRVEIPLGSGRRAVVNLPEDLTASDIRRISAVLKAYVEDVSE
jgi:hypothetical protein